MAIAVDAHGKGTITVSTPQDSSVTLAAGATALYVSVSTLGTDTVSSVTWDQGGTNQAMTQIAAQVDTAAVSRVYLYKLLNPTTGTKTLRVVYSAAPGNGANVYWLSVTGGDTTNGNRTVQTRVGDTSVGPGIADANYVSGDIELHACTVFAATIAFDAGETAQSDNNIGGSGFSGGLSYDTANGTVGCTDQSFYAEAACALIPGGSAAKKRVLAGLLAQRAMRI